jgi:hypothetical protein
MKTLKFTFSAGLLVLSQLVLAQTGSWNLAGNSLTGTEKIGSKNSFPVNFITNDLQRMTLSTSGNLGIGIKAPKAKLHVFKGSSGVTPATNSNLIVESNSSNFISLLIPETAKSGIVFGSTANFEDASITYNDATASRGFVFRTGGGVPRMTLASSGFFGVGTNSPASEIHISHPNAILHGLRIENSTANSRSWNIFEFGFDDGDLGFAADGLSKAFIDRESGSYFTLSDLRAKKDIEQVGNVLQKIMQLDVKKYHFLENKTTDKEHYGMIAQDVEKIFPEIVSHKVGKDYDFYAVNYSAYGVLAIKAIQEQQQKIEQQEQKIKEQGQTKLEQEKKITALEARIAKLEAALNNGTISSAGNNNKIISKEISNFTLEQNQPNPFNQTTVIHYHTPQGATGQINLFDANGVVVKTLKTNGSGQAVINGNDLKTGTYTYTLVVNGRIAASKKLVLVK